LHYDAEAGGRLAVGGENSAEKECYVGGGEHSYMLNRVTQPDKAAARTPIRVPYTMYLDDPASPPHVTREPPGSNGVARESEDLVRGTLDALILKTLTWGPRHGYGIAGWIKATSRDTLIVEDRALYLALHRLEDKGWVQSDWGLSDNNRRAKFYQLTARGRAQLRAESSRLARYADGLFRVLNATSWGSGS